MSKLSKLITAKFSNEREVVTQSYNVSMSLDTSTEPRNYYVNKGYTNTKIEFTAVLGAVYYLPENDKHAVEEALKNVRKGVIQEVFGEFREPLLKIQHLMYTREYTEAMAALQDLQNKMFDV